MAVRREGMIELRSHYLILNDRFGTVSAHA